MKTRSWLLAAAAVLALAPGAWAQDGDAAQRGNRSIALGVHGGPEIGVWMRTGARTDVGLEAALAFTDAGNDEGDTQNTWSLRLGPAVKIFSPRLGPVAPYTYGTLFVGYGSAETESSTGAEAELTNLDFGGAVALGLDWFPVNRVSVGGHVGIRANFTRSDLEGPLGGGGEADGFSIGTFTSGIRAHLYF